MPMHQRWYLLLVLALITSLPTVVSAEVIRDFAAAYVIQTDGSVLVTEQITYDFESAQRHGIFRTLETNHPQPASSFLKTRVVEIQVQSVFRGGNPEPFVETKSSGEIELKIGNADTTISGPHTYELSYVLRGALSYGTDGAELYWNPTGHNWPVSIQTARIVVTGPRGALGSDQACYEGVVGSTAQCDTSMLDEGSMAVFASANVVPGEGMTIAQEINASLIQQLAVERWQWLWIALSISALFLLLLVIFIYRRQTAHKPNVPIIAQYEPYGDLLPMYTGVVFDGRLDLHDITAGIVYLAEQGFIKIKHVETTVLGIFTNGDYELTLLRPVDEAPTPPLKTLLQMIFSAPDPSMSIGGISISVGGAKPTAVVLGETVRLSALKSNALLNNKVVYSLQVAFHAQLFTEGYVERPRPPKFSKETSGAVAALLVVFTVVVYVITGSVPIAIALLVVPLFSFGLLFLQRLTRKGYEARYHLLGFKEFLSVTDKERFDFHNAPEKSPELFMRYLPYAIALKVEDKWAKAFEGITIPNPGWYEGSTVGAFSAATFTSDLSSFATSFKSSSGTSGSSGGGSSGGGGGGGGGGGW